MRRWTACALALLLLLASYPLSALAAAPAYKVTVMVYMCGTDLEEDDVAASADLMEMMMAGIDPKGDVAVLVETGGTREWALDYINGKVNQRWSVEGEKLRVLQKNLGKRNMGDAETLADFVTYCMKKAPADRYMLILWDHGGGPNGEICIDSYTGDGLTQAEIAEALDDSLAGERLDFMAFDACLMGSYEVARNLAPYADYVIFSEEMMEGWGFAYNSMLEMLVQKPNMDANTLGNLIASTYLLSVDQDEPNTMSMVDTSKLAPVGEALAALGEGLSGQLNDGNLRDISRARSGVRDFGYYQDSDHTDLVDIGALCDAYEALLPEETQALRKAVQDAVLVNRFTRGVDAACGLSVFAPYHLAKDEEELALYETFDFMGDYWLFVEEYGDAMMNGTYEFREEVPVTSFVSEDAMGGVSELLAAVQAGIDAGTYEDAYVAQLTQEELDHLAYAEANLMLDVSDEDGEWYIDLGYVQDVEMDMETGLLVGLFDGTWPTLGGQMVCMYDQIVTETSTRSLIPVLVNDVEAYLIVRFDAKNPNGHVIGYTEGYDVGGNPERGQYQLVKGDVVVPTFEMLWWDKDDEMQVIPFEGDEIIAGRGGSIEFGYEPVEKGDYLYSFCLNDIYGDAHYTDYIDIEIK